MGLLAENVSDCTYMLYVIAGAFVYVAAPIMTLSFILKLVKNLSANIRYRCAFWRDAHIFSELNERSLALAKDISRKNRKTRIVFADIIDKNEEAHTDLVEGAKTIGAILFRKDLKAIKFCRCGYQNKERKKRNGEPKKARKINFYLISYDENEKIMHANHIRKDYDWKNVYLYVFSDDVCCEMLMSAKNQKNIKVIRINDIQALIYHNLDEYGTRLFQNAALKNNYTISAVIVGLGRYGLEMLKALTWFCQFPGFNLKIKAFDSDPNSKKRVEAMCPDLLAHSEKKVSGDAEYYIEIHSGVDVESSDFIKKIESIDDATFVFVCLGEDKRNLAVAKRLRETYVHMGISPDIETVVYDTDTSKEISFEWDKDVREQVEYEQNERDYIRKDPGERGERDFYIPDFSGVKNHKNQAYMIHTIGDLDTFYSVDTLPLEDESNKVGSFGYLVEQGRLLDERWSSDARSDGLATCDVFYKLVAQEEKFTDGEIGFFKFDYKDFPSDKEEARQGETEAKLYIDEYVQKKKEKDKLSDEKAKDTADAMCAKLEKYKNLVAIEGLKNPCMLFMRDLKQGIRDLANSFVLDIQAIEAETDLCKRIEKVKELIKNDSPFWRFEYNYRSSVAKALHKRLREQMIELVDNSKINPFAKSISKNLEERLHLDLGLPAEDDDESFNQAFEKLKQTHLPEITRYAINYIIAEERERKIVEAENAKLKAGETPKKSPFDSSYLCRMDLLCIGELEHRRWSAYMRTEGYRRFYKDGIDDRNDLGRIHNNITSSYDISNKTLKNDI